jgi:O-antigen/teichoic acid export membrane protein
MNFRRWVVFTFLIHVLVVVVDKGGGLVLYLLTANQPEQHGKSGIAASLPYILGAIASLGLASAMVWLVRRGRYSAQVCFETAMVVGLCWGGIVAGAAAVVVLWVLPILNSEWVFDPWIVLPICAAVPMLLIASFANSTQLATESIKDYGIVHLLTSVAFLPAFFLIYFQLGANVAAGHVPMAVAWGRLASTVFVVLVTLWLVRKVVKLRMKVHREFLGDALRYGWKANLTSTLTYLNHRIDLPVAVWVAFTAYQRQGLSAEAADKLAYSALAFYSMAVTWAELVWHFPEAMRDLFFSKVAGSSHEHARRLTPVLSRLGLAVSLLGALAVVLLINPAMGAITAIARPGDPVWYRDWSPTVTHCLWVLIPGTVAFTVSKVLQADLGARDRLDTCVRAQSLVLVTMLILDFVLVPEHGAIGAAAASTFAYVLGTAYTLRAYGRQTDTPFWRCLIVHPSDFRYVREICGGVFAKLRRRTT